MTIMDTLGETASRSSFISKGWGYELIFVNNEYCGKLLHIVAGRKCSVHYHKLKHETFYLHKGAMTIFYHDDAKSVESFVKHKPDKLQIYDLMEKVNLHQGQVFTVPVGRVHQMIAIEDCELFEFSTHDDPEDSYRIIKGD